jgi:hypothetical protein
MIVAGISKSGEWPETLRSMLPDNNSSPTTSGAPNMTQLQKGKWLTERERGGGIC